MRVLAMPPPNITLSIDLERELMRLNLVDIFAPPRIATEFFESSFTLVKAFNSSSSNNPAQESLEKLRIATNCGYVLKVGPLAYYDKEKFPTGPWCKKGDWVIFARYAGSRLPIEGGEVRLLNDDEVLGTIGDPEAVLHNI